MPHINLLPWREELRSEKQRQFNVMLAGAAIFMALVVIFVHIQLTAMIEGQNARNKYLESTIKQVEAEIKEIEALKREKTALLARMDVIQRLQSSRPEIVHLFEELSNATPKGVYILNAARNADKINITGMADSNDSVSAFMRNLDASTWLENPKLAVIDSSKKSGDGSWFQLEVTQTKHSEQPIENKKNDKKPTAGKSAQTPLTKGTKPS